MNPRRGIDALGLSRGELVWHSDDAARPLASTGEVLIAQGEPPKPTNRIDPARARRAQRPAANGDRLKPWRRARARPWSTTADGTFAIDARATPTDATLAWEFVEHPRQGVKPGALDFQVPPAERKKAAPSAEAKRPTTTGVIRLDLTSGKAAALPLDQAPARPTERRADLPPAERIASVTGEQFASADGRHVLTSQRVADDSVWEKYQWTVFDRSSGARLGSLRDYRSHASFIVVGSTIIYETGPFERRTDAGLISEPLRIRAVDLTKGGELWTRAVRDTTYRGPLPS